MNPKDEAGLMAVLEQRFLACAQRHPDLAWRQVRDRLAARPAAILVLLEMERTGGEPDVIAVDHATGELTFCDCSPESPAGRRSLCFDAPALAARKEHKPAGSALEQAAAVGITLLTEQDYRALQALGEFDRKTSSWIDTPASIRKQGGALFCDRRYGQVFVYHNGAESYYAARGFRGLVRI